MALVGSPVECLMSPSLGGSRRQGTSAPCISEIKRNSSFTETALPVAMLMDSPAAPSASQARRLASTTSAT